MSSTARTLELLTLFSATRPEIGLSDLCRLAQRDKATTYRHLQTLEEAGFVEQNPASRRYRLGPALLPLAQTREQTVPRKAGAIRALSNLADATGETSHVSVLSGTTLYALASCESSMHGTRAIIDIPSFPLHATASGLCALAYGPTDLFDLASKKMRAFTPKTVTTRDALEQIVGKVRDSGFGISIGSLESEIHSVAVPVFDHTDRFAGSVSVAAVATRVSPELSHSMHCNLVTTSREISRNWGGAIPEQIEAVWANSFKQFHKTESAT